jgi:tRNA nucleotidyltransferase (CCA-adding enzyme)
MDEPQANNLAAQMEEQLPRDLFDFLKKAGALAHERQQRLYLVGGAVRDLFLERCNLDIDLVLEGDAPKMARELAAINGAQVEVHARFGTASLAWRNRRADLATARAETYARPGALPTVSPGTIAEDLTRRDFTINAMAIELNPTHFGELIDPHGGRKDLDIRTVRVLHEKSFSDDATRIWRAVRYEQRLDFQIEPATLALIRRDINMLETITGDRIRQELELLLKEETPEKALVRLDKLGALAKISPSLRADDWLAETFATAAEECFADKPHSYLYLALLFYRLPPDETKKAISYLHFSKAVAQILRDTAAIRTKTVALSVPGLAPSEVYALVHGYHLVAIKANALGAGSETAAEHLELYMNVLRDVNPSLTGEDLLKLGVPEGPKVKEVLQKLRQAILDGKIATKKEEEEMVRGWLKS